MSHRLLTSLQTSIDRMNQILAQTVSWFTLLMVIITFAIVVLRYGFNLGWIALQESVMYLHAGVFLLGAANTLRTNEHVRVDIIYRQLSFKSRSAIDFVGTLFLLVPVNLVIVGFSWKYVSDSWWLLESSQEAGGLPLVFLLKSFILLFAITMLLQGVAEMIRHGVNWLNGEQK